MIPINEVDLHTLKIMISFSILSLNFLAHLDSMLLYIFALTNCYELDNMISKISD